MTDDAVASILEAELETGALLLDTLDRQRRALIARDLDLINDLTGALEEQVAQFMALAEARASAVGDAVEMTGRRAELLRLVRRTEGRMLRLARLNQDLIADRLACVGAMLSTLGLAGAAGYGPGGRDSALSRSA